LSRVVKKAAGQSLTDLSLFDVYRSDKHLGPGLKSYAVQLTFEDMDKTMSDVEVDTIIDKVIASVAKVLDGKLRA